MLQFNIMNSLDLSGDCEEGCAIQSVIYLVSSLSFSLNININIKNVTVQNIICK
jgi:hypothetical protein